TFVCSNKPPIDLSNSRPPQSDDDLRYWLQNMVGDHGFSVPETQEATGLDASSIRDALDRFGIERGQQAPSVAGGPRLRLLPYPGGRHPRIGFREAAIRPQRETKASVFTPWDPKSYVVLDVPEAIWSNLGLTYLAHVDVPTLWEQKEIGLKPLEWRRGADGRLQCERELPNGIRFGVDLVPRDDSVQMAMWIHNGTESELTGLRVQNCALLAGANGFSAQTNDNKVFWKSYAACRDDSGKRWIIMAWSPIHGAWGNAECPCLHADPKFADCPPGDTVSARGMLSFFTGTDIQSELQRLEQTGWREGALATRKVALRGNIVDAETGKPVAARVRLQDSRGRRYTVNSTAGQAVGYRRELSHLPDSPEVHTSVSADPFHVDLEPGVYSLRVERGKEYLPALQTIRVGDAGADVEVRLQRWANAAERGWYSGDLHVHRPLEELPTAMLAEDLNVSFPITQWVTDSRSIPSEARSRDWGRGLIRVDPSHVIQTRNTEYEIITVNGRRHTLGSLLVLNQRTPLTLGTPPVAGVAGDVQRQGALLDLDKHSWPWSLVIAPVMGVDLFELANNHLWETDFGFHDFTVDTVGEYMNLERNSRGLTERGWLHYGLETYYALLNCGLDLRVSAGTASGVHPVPLGFGRVYVHLSSGFDFEAWMEGLSAGRSFVTTGPLLYARFNGAQPGARLVAGGERAQAVLVEGEALSRSPLRRIEVLRNGELVHSIVPANVKLAAGGYRSRFEVDVSVDSTSWVAVRCFEDRVDGRVRFAHTNPAHVAVPGRPLMPSKEQIDYLVARVRQEVRNNASVLDQASLAEFRRALGFYEAIATRVHAQKDREERVAHAP
ncbi:MAG: CehA/McbA family metallohydrolase, partial [Planctomycetota bacterium]